MKGGLDSRFGPRSFNTRSAFLSSAHRILSPSGTLALTDLLLPPTPLPWHSTLLLRLLFLLAGAPWQNFLTTAEYRAQLVEHGFDEHAIEMDDISERVWPAFCAFVREREERLGRGVLGAKWKGLVRYARIVEWYAGVQSGKPKLRFFLVSAKKAD